MINYINETISHKSFGNGTITGFDGKYLTVAFEHSKKKFVFPDCFEKFLIADSDKLKTQINEIIQAIQAERTMQEEVRSRQIQEEKKRIEEESALRKSRKKKDTPPKDIAFKCNQTNDMSWKIPTGVVKSGERKGMPMKLQSVKNGSLCVLTDKDAKADEKERFIFGVFIVDENFGSGSSEEGFIGTQSKYKLILNNEEAHSMLFWKYHANGNKPNVPSWNSGLHRYITHDSAAQILYDIMSVKNGTDDEELSIEMADYFFRKTGINKKDIKDPKGALML